MEPNLKISGIYDLRTMTFLKQKGVRSFAFDFNPRSLNFLQGQLLRQIVHEHYSTKDQYTLSFGKTSKANMDNTINDFLMATGTARSVGNGLWIELPEDHLELMAEINLSVMLAINLQSPVETLAKTPEVQGFILDYSSLNLELDQTKAFHFLNRLFLIKESKENFRIDLRMGLENSLARSILDFYSFDYIDLTINRNVEVCYRNVNLALLEKEIQLFTESIA